MDTHNFINSLPISYLHVFPYSKRPGTVAFSFPDQLNKVCKSDRTKRLIELSNQKKRIFYTEHLQSIREVLFESETSNHQLSGFTDNYIKVKLSGKQDLINCIKKVRLHEIMDDDSVWGSLINEE